MRKRTFILAVAVVVVASAPVFGQTTRFVALGDSRGEYGGINAPILAELATAIIAENPDLVLFVGDLVTNGTQPQLENWIAAFWDPLKAAGIPVYPIRGNHDGSISAWNTVFSGTRALPDNGPPGEENLTYSFVYNNAMFIGLDQYMPGTTLRVNQPWLDEQLAGCTLPHVFVFGHVPAFIVGHIDCLAAYTENRDAFWNSLAQAGVRAYFAGHDHFLDHARVATARGGTIEQYVVGAAGAPLYEWAGIYPEAQQVAIQGISHRKNYSYAVVDIEGYEVAIQLKERTDSGEYVSTGDVLHYTGPLRGEGVPVEGIAGIFVTTTAIVIAFAARMRAGRQHKH